MADRSCEQPPFEIVALVVTRFAAAMFECFGEVESEVDWNKRIERKRGETQPNGPIDASGFTRFHANTSPCMPLNHKADSPAQQPPDPGNQQVGLLGRGPFWEAFTAPAERPF